MISAHHTELLQTIDTALRSRAIVYGSLPPVARDIDLLVTSEDAAAIGRRLQGEGFTAWNRAFVAFRGCSVLVVELIPAGSLRLPTDELNGLFAEALPLGQLAKVTEPAPHHTLLILARRLARESVLRPKHRDRIDRALTRDSAAWQRAWEHAAPWAAEPALTHLQALHNRGSDGRFRLTRPLPRPRRTRVIAVAGADSVLTRSQADSLRDSLDRLGFNSLVERPVPGAQSGFGAITSALSLWRPIWRQLGRGNVLIYEFQLRAPLASAASQPWVSERGRRSRRVFGLLSPRPLRSYVVDASRPRDQLCEGFAEDAWRALVHRSPLEVAARRLVAAVRQMPTGLRGRRNRGPREGGPRS